MKLLRSILFWSHLAAGLAAGIVILIMSATGAAIALKPQITNFIERDVRYVAASDGSRLPISQIVAAAQAGRPAASVSQITVDRDPSRAVAVGLERIGTVYVNPYTAAVSGEGSTRTQSFFRALENWHRWVGMSNENRATAKSITGASNLAFLGLAISGIYLWWPRTWSPQHTRAILGFRRTKTGRARDFNWHNVIGFWCAPAIIVMTTTALMISYPWANNVIYQLTGSPVPGNNREQQRPAEGGRGGRQGGPRGEGQAARAERAAVEGARREGRGERAAEAPLTAEVIDRAWSRAEAQVPTWSTISMRGSNGQAPLAFTVTDGESWNAFARSQLTVSAASGEVERWQPYDESSLGQKVRGGFRFAHTGELGGLTGQIVAGIGCLGGVVLVWTGLALAFRRLLNWRALKTVLSRRRSVTADDATGLAAPARSSILENS